MNCPVYYGNNSKFYSVKLIAVACYILCMLLVFVLESRTSEQYLMSEFEPLPLSDVISFVPVFMFASCLHNSTT
jgi:hypothetical protein